MRSYQQHGVDYEILDAAKRHALEAARSTSSQLERHGGASVDASRGEPGYVFRIGDLTLVHVIEGLGTKSIITRRYEEASGHRRYDAIARDAAAAVINDLLCAGARPLVVNAYFATGGDSWYGEPERHAQLVDGWRDACVEAGAAWGGGESPSLPDLLTPGELEIAGSAVGYVPSGEEPLLGDALAPGDAIVLVESSGLHANGASIARGVADRLPDGLLTVLSDGETLGDHLLRPSHLYARLVADIRDEGLPVTYVSHITGHGFRKVMRSARALTYRITELPEVPEVLRFLAQQEGMDDQEAYGTFNMGAGLAVYCRPGAAEDVVRAAGDLGLRALVAGHVEDGPRAVVLEPIDCAYGAGDLQLR
jgi:phosphoribosylformylglycinamidine cyclo-ligase